MNRTARVMTVVIAMMVATFLCQGEVGAQHSMYIFPVERAFLESRVDVQLDYRHFDRDWLKLDSVFFSVEGQVSILDRIELGLNVPFITYAAWTYGPRHSDEEVHMGDMIVDVKGRLFGKKWIAVSAFINTRIPTHSWDDEFRNYVVLHTGAVISLLFGGLEFGGGPSGMVGIIGDGAEDVALFGFDMYVGYKLLGLLWLRLATQYHNEVAPGDELNLFSIIPGVELELWIFHVGLATRIAVTDEAELVYGGRASVLFHGGISF